MAMKIPLRIIGLFQNGIPARNATLYFDCNKVTLCALYADVLEILRSQEILFDEHDLLLAVDGKVIPRDCWDIFEIAEGHVCSLFPVLAGG